MNAIIGATASGKSALAIQLARKFKLDIFSIDSLSIYKYIDIASAKPNKKDLSEIKHYGVDLLEPSDRCSAKIFFDLLQNLSKQSNKMIIVGGSSFYLKSIISGLSFMPKTTPIIESFLSKLLEEKAKSYEFLSKIDLDYAKKINPNDKYRIQKALEIFLLTNKPPSIFFKDNERKKIDIKINIFELLVTKEELVNNIILRTQDMFQNGLIDEVIFLKQKYPLSQALKAIGIKEILSFLDNKISMQEAKNLIIKNTLGLAKRQKTFNRTQFLNTNRGDKKSLKEILENAYKSQLS